MNEESEKKLTEPAAEVPSPAEAGPAAEPETPTAEGKEKTGKKTKTKKNKAPKKNKAKEAAEPAAADTAESGKSKSAKKAKAAKKTKAAKTAAPEAAQAPAEAELLPAEETAEKPEPLKMISIRLSQDLIDTYKRLAVSKDTVYQRVMRKALIRYAETEVKKIFRKEEKSQQKKAK